MQSSSVKFQIVFSIFLYTLIPAPAQEADSISALVINNPDTLVIGIPDSIRADTVITSPGSGKTNPIESPVTYNATDSMIISIENQKMFLYGDAKVDYENIELTAYYVEFDMSDNVVMAAGRTDTVPSAREKPLFKQDDESFESDTIRYNFKTKKGLIKHIVTEEGDGFLQAQRTKKLANGHINIKNGKYTTCDAPHPHFYIGLTKAIAIPDDKIVSGPAYFVMEDIPLPLVLPFGFFPNSKNRSAGILFPTYGEEKARGLYLRQGGFYFPVNDYMDIAIQGDVYFRGTWGLNAKSSYVRRYRYRGNLDGRMYFNKISDDVSYPRTHDYSIRWSHTQDPKANPTRTLSASVNISSQTYDRNYSHSVEDYLSGTTNKASSISYSKRWGSLFVLSASLNYNQNNRDSTVMVNFPKMAFTMNQIYPFRSKNLSGKPKWYENIQIRYMANLDNQISSKDTALFSRSTLRSMRNGFSHSIPISLSNFRLFKIINITPSISYKGVLYGSHIEKRLPDSLKFGTNFRNSVVTDTIFGFNYAQAISTAIGVSVNPKFYGMYRSKRPNSYIQAIRHVITPSASFNFAPDMSKIMPDYYRKIVYARSITDKYQEEKYSVYDKYLYGTPVAQGRSGSLSLGLSNNLEMKVQSKNDTTNELRKVSILDNLNFATSYNPFLDSMRWSQVSMNGSTRLFNNKINLNFSGGFSPYALDINGREHNRSYFAETGKLLRVTRLSVTIGMSFTSAAGKNKQQASQPVNPAGAVRETYSDDSEVFGDYVDFNIPWSLRIDYSWSYNRPLLSRTLSNTISISGDMSLTRKWKVGGRTGYDFISKKFTMTNLNVSRDLHCWEMRISVVPFGSIKSYAFTINAKSSLLRDLKWDKRKSWYDYY